MVLFFLKEDDIMVLRKSDVVNGADSYEEYKLETADDTVFLRPLTVGEIHQISEMKNKALGDYTANQRGVSSKKRMKAQIDAQAKMNMEKITIADNKADILIVKFGLDNKGNPDKWTEQDIRNLSIDLFEEIRDKVKEISHMDDEDVDADVDSFPENE